MNGGKRAKSIHIIVWAVHIALFITLAVLISEYNKVAYTDDWYYVDPLLMESWEEVASWIFAPHAEHRIPIQKAIHLGLSYISGYDFRVLILFNLIVASITSVLVLSTARIYRGYQHWGDLIIPLVILSPWSIWLRMSFQLQFLLSIFFVAAYLYFISKYVETGRKRYYNLGLSQLFLCAFTGVNGLIFATVSLLGAFSFFFLGNYKLKIKSDKLQLAFTSVVLIEIILHWVFFQTSGATGFNINFLYVVEVFIKLIPASLFVFATDNPALKSFIIIVPLMFVGWCFYRKMRGRKLTNLDVVLGVGLLSSLAIILSIPVGRGDFHGSWQPFLIMHYGCLTVLLPILAWVIISTFPKKKFLVVLTFLMVGFFGYIFFLNYGSRVAYERTFVTTRQDIYKALNEEQNIDMVVDKYILQFWYKDEPLGRERVKRGISTLRRYDYPIYRLEKNTARNAD